LTDQDIGLRRDSATAGELPDLGTIRHIYELAEVANLRSIRAAARSLKISENTLRRHIDALEERLGETLLERSRRGVILTEAGHHVVATGQAMQEAYHSNYRLSNKRQRSAAAGTVRLGATDGLATYWLMPHLAQYQRENPQLNVQLLCDLGIEERSYGASDISVRLSATSDEAYVSSPLATLHLLPYAAPAYLERHGRPGGIEDWPEHRIIWQSGVDLRSMLPSYLPLMARSNIVLESNSSAVHYAAIKSGVGIGLLPTYASLVDPELVPLDLLHPAPRQQLYLTYRRQLLDCRARVVHWVRRIFDQRTYPWFADVFHHPTNFEAAPAYRATSTLLRRQHLP
jgi:DNA-binding transcriptional LysR family regulator